MQEKNIDNQIKFELNNIKKMQSEIQLYQATSKDIMRREKELLEEISDVKDNTKKIIYQRDMLLKDKNTDKDISLLLYFSTIQQNVAYYDTLSSKVYAFGETKKKIKTKINTLNENIDNSKIVIESFKLRKTRGLKDEIDNINVRKKTLNLQKRLISNINVIQNPEVLPRPVKPKKKQIILLSVVVGLFFMIFLAFFIEYIKNASKGSSANKRA